MYEQRNGYGWTVSNEYRQHCTSESFPNVFIFTTQKPERGFFTRKLLALFGNINS